MKFPCFDLRCNLCCFTSVLNVCVTEKKFYPGETFFPELNFIPSICNMPQSHKHFNKVPSFKSDR